MVYTIGEIDIATATVQLPPRGVWFVRAVLASDRVPQEGARVEARLGDLVLRGTVRCPQVHVGRASLLVVAGAGRWGSARVAARPYRANNGVRLATVAADLARDAGEQLAPLSTTEVLGYAWTRPAGLAVHALEDLGRPWHVDLAGQTQIGVRTRTRTSGAEVSLQLYLPETRRAVLSSPKDQLALFVPGSILSADGVPEIEILGSTIVVADQKAHAEVMIA